MSEEIMKAVQQEIDLVNKAKTYWASRGFMFVEFDERDIKEMLNRILVAARAESNRISELEAEVERLHSWQGLMSILDEHYPPDVFDGSSGEPGARIIALIREVERLKEVLLVVRDAADSPTAPAILPAFINDALKENQ